MKYILQVSHTDDDSIIDKLFDVIKNLPAGDQVFVNKYDSVYNSNICKLRMRGATLYTDDNPYMYEPLYLNDDIDCSLKDILDLKDPLLTKLYIDAANCCYHYGVYEDFSHLSDNSFKVLVKLLPPPASYIGFLTGSQLHFLLENGYLDELKLAEIPRPLLKDRNYEAIKILVNLKNFTYKYNTMPISLGNFHGIDVSTSIDLLKILPNNDNKAAIFADIIRGLGTQQRVLATIQKIVDAFNN